MRGRPKKNIERDAKIGNIPESQLLETLEIQNFLESSDLNCEDFVVFSFNSDNDSEDIESFNYFFVILNKILKFFNIEELNDEEVSILNSLKWKVFINENYYKGIMVFSIVAKRILKFLLVGDINHDNQYLWKDGSRENNPESDVGKGNIANQSM